VAALREREIAWLADRQHGAVSRRQLLDLGFGADAIKARLQAGRLHPLHRGVYAVGRRRLNQRGDWMAAVLACGEDSALSHRGAAALWGLVGARSPIDVTSSQGRPGRKGIRLHRGRLDAEERTRRDGIPVTTVARTLLDLADAVDEQRLRRTFEEADRLNLLRLAELERVCDRAVGRRGVGICRRLAASLTATPRTRSPLEQRFVGFCDRHRLPRPVFNTEVLGHEVDALWPGRKLAVELDSWGFHRHRAAFEDDRERDAALQVAGYRTIRVTDRRMKRDGAVLAAQLRELLGP
jgi:very-short-patch-repair endonuclease